MLSKEYPILPELLPLLTNNEMDADEIDLIATSTDEVNYSQEEEMWFVIGNNNKVVEFLGCPSEDGLLAIAHQMGVFCITKPDIIIKAYIHNPEMLPYSAPPNKSIIVIYKDQSIKRCGFMYDAIKFIEEIMSRDNYADILDFAVLIGDEVEFNEAAWEKLVANSEALYNV